jgi:hypothetical protein
MNETKWLGFDGDDMLDFVADRIKPRQWVLLAAAYVRRLWDLLPEGTLRQAIDAAERADEPLSEVQRGEWLRRIDAAVPEAIGAAELAQRDIVKSCDPDSADQENPVLSRPNQIAPAFPLFQAASRHARNAITGIGEAMGQAVHAVRGLFAEPNELMLSLVRQRVEQAAETRTQANQAANLALRFKLEGDELADRAASAKNKRLEESKAHETVRRLEEGQRNREDDIDAEIKRERAASKQLARVLREVVGNPFRPPRFEPAWRTTTVLELARGIFDDRAYDRMPILADALLDADCDEETVLRHLRGTEKDVKEQPAHVRGCWVLELILGRWEPLPPPPPGTKPRRSRRPWDDLDIGLPPLGDDRLA